MFNPTIVTDIFAEHFVTVSRKDDEALMARHRRQLELNDFDFFSLGGESYNVPFLSSELQSALSQWHDSSPGLFT